MSNKEAHLEGAPFVVKTYQLVGDLATNGLVGWSETRDSFVVWKPVEFASEVLPQYFKHNNFCSFIRYRSLL
jgi:heat shock transcription factor